jgi:hypothetical protein
MLHCRQYLLIDSNHLNFDLSILVEYIFENTIIQITNSENLKSRTAKLLRVLEKRKKNVLKCISTLD